MDYGKRRVGIAIADPLRLFAQPYGTFDPTGAVEALRRLHAEQGIETLVVGWPLTPEGEEGETSRLVQEYINRLRNAIPGIDIVKWDERFSSQRARAAILEAGVRRKGRRDRGRVDAAAAAVVLQEYLDEAREA